MQSIQDDIAVGGGFSVNSVKHSGHFKPAGQDPRRGEGGARPGAGRKSNQVKANEAEATSEFYNEELHYFQDTNQKHKQCACGCGQPVFDRKKWASPACKKRIQRNGERNAAKNVTDMQKGVLQIADLIEAKPGQNQVIATYPLTDRFPGI